MPEDASRATARPYTAKPSRCICWDAPKKPRSVYEKLLPDNSTDAELVTNMIRLALARGEHDKAREYSEKLLRVAPQCASWAGRDDRGRHGARRL